MKPSERIKQIHDSLMNLDGKEPVEIDMYVALAIIRYLDEKEKNQLNQKNPLDK